MYVGIDVGGTFTDGVLLSDKEILKKVKIPTTRENLLECLLKTLDSLITNIDIKSLKRVSFSTTLITNLVVEGKVEPTALILIPGPGLNPNHFNFRTFTKVIPGAIDFRGREINPLSEISIKEALKEIDSKGYKKVAIAGKFAQRNNSHELKIESMIKKDYCDWQVMSSHKVSGELNFPRRAATTLLTVATAEFYSNFVEHVEKALRERSITAPTYILKADGGTLPLADSVRFPLETIYSGPAASLLGALSLLSDEESVVVLDIGGTTSDIGMIINGKPLLSSKGAIINDYSTQVRTFHVNSIAVGGDSMVQIKDGTITLGPGRVGTAYCAGGPAVTPTDALRVLGYCDFGDLARANEGLTMLGQQINLRPRILAEKIVKTFSEIIETEILRMYQHWELEPAYHILELQRKKNRAQTLVGIGGGAKGIVELVAQKMGYRVLLPKGHNVVNAIGTALALPTATVTLRVDTEQGVYSFLEKGLQHLVPTKRFDEKNSLDLALNYLYKLNQENGSINVYDKYDLLTQESFNIIRGNYRVGKIIITKVQTPWQIAFQLI